MAKMDRTRPRRGRRQLRRHDCVDDDCGVKRDEKAKNVPWEEARRRKGGGGDRPIKTTRRYLRVAVQTGRLLCSYFMTMNIMNCDCMVLLLTQCLKFDSSSSSSASVVAPPPPRAVNNTSAAQLAPSSFATPPPPPPSRLGYPGSHLPRLIHRFTRVVSSQTSCRRYTPFRFLRQVPILSQRPMLSQATYAR